MELHNTALSYPKVGQNIHFKRFLYGRIWSVHYGATADDSGIIDQDADLTNVFFHPFGYSIDIFSVAYVTLEALRFATRRFNLLHCFFVRYEMEKQ